MSALPPKADIDRACLDVRFVPEADIPPFIRSPCYHGRRARFHDPIPKTNSISRLAMRHGLGCSAVNCIVAHQYKPTFLMIPVYCRRKTKAMLPPIIRFIQQWKRYGRVVQELSRFSDRELADIGIARCDIDRIARGQFRQ